MAAIGPDAENYQQTLSTLKYGQFLHLLCLNYLYIE